MTDPSVLISGYVPHKTPYDRRMQRLALVYAELYHEAEVERRRRGGELFGQEMSAEVRHQKHLCVLIAALARRALDLLEGMRDEDVVEAFEMVFWEGGGSDGRD